MDGCWLVLSVLNGLRPKNASRLYFRLSLDLVLSVVLGLRHGLLWRASLSRRRHGRAHGRGSASALATSAESYLNALGVTFNFLRVDVIFALVGGASVESAITVVLQGTTVPDGESAIRRGAFIALELSCRGREDTASAGAVGDLAVVDAVGSFPKPASNTILSIVQLAKGSGDITRRAQLEATSLVAREDGRRGVIGEAYCSNEGLHLRDC